jgi:2,4-dienoyl-CoA reductase-like NADH-dependent reductase (Old Yellow Enzyme family)
MRKFKGAFRQVVGETSRYRRRSDRFGQDRLAFAEAAISAVKKDAPDLPFMIRISGNEMSPEFGIDREDLLLFIQMAERAGVVAIHVGMGSSCFSPPGTFTTPAYRHNRKWMPSPGFGDRRTFR